MEDSTNQLLKEDDESSIDGVVKKLDIGAVKSMETTIAKTLSPTERKGESLLSKEGKYGGSINLKGILSAVMRKQN